MSDRLRLPTEAELPGLIRTAFDQMPGPDADRLELIFERLPVRSQRPERQLAPWWAILLMGSGAALAAWGVHEIIESAREQSPREFAMPPQAEMLPEVEIDEMPQDDRDSQNPPADESEADDRRPGSVIYQRENF